ncbi:DUF3558 domain-containing protein [Gordonia otitidis]|uniref:DUF3558 family protein n=1 Tax=Gordonia otitidis TaxID=249058 RepID=UPI001D1569D5|nr:DUF3558 domain-containing protein [Gordonia otitidis]
MGTRTRKLARHFALSALALSLLCSCETSGAAQPTSIATADRSALQPTVRQSDDSGQNLPFATRFPRRWNSGNDGTPYEPCTAADSTLLETAGLQASSVKDAASVDFQTARGCTWDYKDYELASLSQTVGDSRGLDVYKQNRRTDTTWLGDIEVSTRPVALGVSRDETGCGTYLESGNSIVATSALFIYKPPPISEICDKAIAFTRATIDQMPE